MKNTKAWYITLFSKVLISLDWSWDGWHTNVPNYHHRDHLFCIFTETQPGDDYDVTILCIIILWFNCNIGLLK
jgi:hypothetical protein